MEEKIKKKVNDLRLDKVVKFLGQREDVNELYQAMDVFVLPSLYEGLGMVLIEAQCSGLPCICSTEVPKVAKVTKNLTFVSLNESVEKWACLIKKLTTSQRKIELKELTEKKFDIQKESEKFVKKYIVLDKLVDKYEKG